jgi:RNA polymerase sigma-32 factor
MYFHKSALQSYFRQACAFRQLGDEEERNRIREWQQDKNIKARNEIVKSNLKIAFLEAVRYSRYGIPIEDLVSEATFGIIKSLDDFDLELEGAPPFRPYARMRIRNVIRDYIANNWGQMHLSQRSRRFLFALLKRRTQFDTLEEIINDMTDYERAKIGKKQAAWIYQQYISQPARSLHEMAPGEVTGPEGMSDKRAVIDMLADPNPSYHEVLAEQQELEQRLDILADAMNQMDVKELTVFTGRYLMEDGPMGMDDLGRKIGHSDRQMARKFLVRAEKKVIAAMLGSNEHFHVTFDKRALGRASRTRNKAAEPGCLPIAA